MPSRLKSILLVIFLAAFGCISSHAAFVYTETFSTGSNGWHWIRPQLSGNSSFTGGVARMTLQPIPFLPTPFDYVVLSSTNATVVSGGAFTGDYQAAGISSVGFRFFAFNLASTNPYNTVDLQWGNNSNAFYKSFTPTQTGVWFNFSADMRCYDEGGWTTMYGSPTNFQATLNNVRFVQIKFFGADSSFTGSRTNTYLVDDIFINTLTNYTTSVSNQTINFPAIPDQAVNDVLQLRATASSGLPAYFSVLSGPAVIGCCTSVTFTGTGVVSIVATQNGNTNFNAAANVTNTFNVIDPRPVATVQLQGLSQTYDGTARVVTATTAPTGLSVSITYNGSPVPPTNAGTYSITGVVNDATYRGLATGTLVVAKAAATVEFTSLSEVYNGLGRCASVTTVPSNLAVGLTYEFLVTCPTDPGSYLVIATVNDLNYAGGATNVFVITKMPASVHLAGLNTTYDGTARCISATTTPTGLVVDLSYDGLPFCPTNAGFYTIVGEINDPLYAGSVISTMIVDKAAATVSITNLLYTFTGDDYCAQAESDPPGLAVLLTYNGAIACPVNAGSYNVVATISNLNYQGSATNLLVIEKAYQSILFNALPAFVYGDDPYAMFAYADSGLPVLFTSSDEAVASVSGSTLSILGAGTADITASQAGGTNYLAASNVVRVAVAANLVAELDARLLGTSIQLDIIGNTGRTYVIQQTTNLIQSTWQTLVVITNLPTSTYQVVDPATNSSIYYRLKRPVWSP